MVNQTWLAMLSAVPTPFLTLEVHRGKIPGQPGAFAEVMSDNPSTVHRTRHKDLVIEVGGHCHTSRFRRTTAPVRLSAAIDTYSSRSVTDRLKATRRSSRATSALTNARSIAYN